MRRSHLAEDERTGEAYVVDAAKLLSAWMLDAARYRDVSGRHLDDLDSRLFRGLALSMIPDGTYLSPDTEDLVDRGYMFDIDATVEGVDPADTVATIGLVRGLPTDALPALTAEVYGMLHERFLDGRGTVHRASATCRYNSDQGLEVEERVRFLMDRTYRSTELRFDALVDDRGVPVALLPEGSLTHDRIERLAELAGCGIDWDDDSPPTFLLIDPDHVVTVDRRMLDRSTDPVFLGALCMAEAVVGTVWKLAVLSEISFIEACKEEERLRSEGVEVEECEFVPVDGAVRERFDDLLSARFISMNPDGRGYRINGGGYGAENVLFAVTVEPYRMLDDPDV